MPREGQEKSIPWPPSRKKIMCDTWKTLILLVWLLPLLCSGINLHTRRINIFFPNCTIYYFTLQSTLVTIQTSVKKVHIFRICKKNCQKDRFQLLPTKYFSPFATAGLNAESLVWNGAQWDQTHIFRSKHSTAFNFAPICDLFICLIFQIALWS